MNESQAVRAPYHAIITSTRLISRRRSYSNTHYIQQQLYRARLKKLVHPCKKYSDFYRFKKTVASVRVQYDNDTMTIYDIIFEIMNNLSELM